MRIITGTARGCRLDTLPGQDTRPTGEKVKEGLFSAIQFEIEGRRVLDLFAGSGQLGIEALSRGAAGCVFVDRNPAAVAVVRANLQRAGLTANTQVLNTDAATFVAHLKDSFDIVFLDPPYKAGELPRLLEQIGSHVNAGGVVICESDSDTTLAKQIGTLSLHRSRRYGHVMLWYYRHTPEEVEE